MKKLLMVAMMTLGLAAQAWAESVVYSFMPAGYSISVSNAILGVTNTASVATVGGVGWGTNIVNTMYTNNVGTQCLCTNDVPLTGTGIAGITNDTTSLIRDVDNPLVHWQNTLIPWADSAVVVNTNYTAYRIVIKIHGVNAAANSAVNFRFIPLPDGVTEGSPAYNIAVTANGTSYVIADTTIPVGIFKNARKIRCRSIDNADTDANSKVWVDLIELCGVAP